MRVGKKKVADTLNCVVSSIGGGVAHSTALPRAGSLGRDVPQIGFFFPSKCRTWGG